MDRPDLQGLLESEREHDRRVLREAETPLELGALPLAVAARTDPVAARLGQTLGVACARGCSWCCRGPVVEVPPPEAILIAELLRVRHAHELPALADRLSLAAARAAELSVSERWRLHVPCHFLDDATGACTIYEARPLACRSVSSLDASACQIASDSPRGSTAIPSPEPIDALYLTARRAQHEACTEAGLDMHPLELTVAVERAFRAPRFAERWRAGERSFEHAALPPRDVISSAELVSRSRKAANEKKRQRRANRS